MRGVVGETVLGRYRLESLVAEGGFGQVWKARQLSLDRVVAVKFLRPGRREEPSIRERFRREARLLAGIAHPHVVTCHDFDVDPDGDLVLVMEYLEGRTLLDFFRRREVVSLSRIVEWISQASEGLWEAHARGIVHRDVKPSNLFVADCGGRRERLKVIDFGILRADLRAHPDLEGLTRSGMVVGTPEYLAPEVALGRPAAPGSDQYALGLVAFEMIALRKAFPPWEEGGGMARISGRPEGMDFQDTGRRVPPAVREVIWRALSPIPEERYATIREFGEALREGAGLARATGEPPTRVQVAVPGRSDATRTQGTRLEPPPKWRGVGRRAIAGAIGVLLLAVIGAAGLRWLSGAEGNGPSQPGEAVLGQTPPLRPPDLPGMPEPGAPAPQEPEVGKASDSSAGPGGTLVEGPAVGGPAASGAVPAPKPVHAVDSLPPEGRTAAIRGRRESRGAVPGEDSSGRLSLNAMPWADVYLDDRALGRTPIRDLEVPAGDHRVRFVHPSLGEVRRMIRVEAGRAETLGVDLTAQTGPGP